MARSLNKAQLIGNLTRDPELRYTPQGTAVVSFSIATNRQWKTESGDTRDEAEFHRIVAWDKLAEICGSMLSKGKRVYVEGRLQTRSWTGQDGNKRTTTEIVISDMILLTRRDEVPEASNYSQAGESLDDVPADLGDPTTPGQASRDELSQGKVQKKSEEKKAKAEAADDIPF